MAIMPRIIAITPMPPEKITMVAILKRGYIGPAMTSYVVWDLSPLSGGVCQNQHTIIIMF